MTWGIQMEYSYNNTLDLDKIKEQVKLESEQIIYNNNPAINNTSVYTVTGENTVAIVVWFYNNIEEKKLEELKLDFRDKTLEILKIQDSEIIESKYVNIWKSFGDYIKNTAFLTLAIAIIAITIYVTWAFSWVVWGISVLSFSLITLVTLFHDVIISSGLYIFSSIFFKEFQIDTFFITALLTILWYSINDTIVVFDRIRSNLKEFWGKKWALWKDLEEIVNLSIGETITRSIYTSLTLLFVLFTIFLFWPETI